MARILVIDDEAALRSRISRLLGGQGHEVVEAINGQEGLVQLHERKPELILLDFIMPKMNGFQFCGAVRAIGDYRAIPIVLLSARSDRVGENFIERFDLRDAISKPFEDEALLAVVNKVLGDSEKGYKAPPAKAMQDAFERVEDNRPFNLMSEAAELFTDFVIDQISDLEPRADDIMDALYRGLIQGTPSGARRLLEILELGEVGSTLSGNLSDIAVADMMQFLALQKQTGVLKITLRKASVSVQFLEGQVVLATAKGVRSEFLLGRYLVEEGILTRRALERFLLERKGEGVLGEQLLKLGNITRGDLGRVLTRQTVDLIVEIQRWQRGRFWFIAGGEIAGAEEAQKNLEVSHLVMEGYRQVDEWRVIEKEIPHFDMVFVQAAKRATLFDTTKLTPEELFVLNLVDGKQAVRTIIDASDMGSFAVCKILYRLLSVKLIKSVPQEA